MRLKILFVFFALVAKLSPATAQADSVCASNSIVNYHVNGSAGSTFLWNTQGNGTILSGQGNDSVRVQWSNVPGTYSISVQEKNAGGCDGLLQKLTVVVYQTPATTVTISLKCPSDLPYTWNGNNYNAPGIYSVTLTSTSGCDSIATLILSVSNTDCGDIYFPSAISPSGNPANKTFGALGNLSSITDYSLKIYNRYGELVFATSNPYKKWDARYKEKLNGNFAFVWYASYTLNGRVKKSKKGTLVVVK